ncbi:MAG: hypothetical protein AAF203_01550 [Pseudomonadota bacterium]
MFDIIAQTTGRLDWTDLRLAAQFDRRLNFSTLVREKLSQYSPAYSLSVALGLLDRAVEIKEASVVYGGVDIVDRIKSFRDNSTYAFQVPMIFIAHARLIPIERLTPQEFFDMSDSLLGDPNVSLSSKIFIEQTLFQIEKREELEVNELNTPVLFEDIKYNL